MVAAATRKKNRTVLQAGDFKARALAVMRKVHDTGEEVTVTSHGRPLVRIVALRAEGEPVGYGCMRGTFELLVPEDRAPGASPRAWGTLREWDEAQTR
jgi:prevent-host-death family protein